MMKFEIHLNDTVEVVLSDYGAKVYNEYYWDLDIPVKYAPATKQAGEVLRDTLWYMMHVFGPAVSIGQQSPFVECRMIFEQGGR
jgi:hypothetical protein